MTAPAVDPYAELGLSPDADEATVRQTFRRLAFELHPDRNPAPDAAEAFVRIREAYEALLDPMRREAEAVIASVLQAAAAAERTRRHTGSAPRPVSFTLANGRRGLAAELAARVVKGLVVMAVVAVGLAVLTGLVAFLVLGALCLGAAPMVWLTRQQTTALRLYGDGFEDGRWPTAGRIGWGDIYALDPDYAASTLDLALSETTADRLAARSDAPRDVLVWQGTRPFYRLLFGADAKKAVAAIEARSGLSAR